MANNMTMEEAIKNATKVTAGTPAVTLPTGAGKGKPAQEAKSQVVTKTEVEKELEKTPHVRIKEDGHPTFVDDTPKQYDPSAMVKTKEEVSQELRLQPLAQPPLLTLAQLEKLYILDILNKSGNNKTKAAEILGVSLKTIYNKLASYEAKETK
jgi:DNA-binding NtrC family response regulator